jgi:Mn2+/Fe2+ NRAMP family transporter
VLGVKHSLEHAPREAPWFYGTYTVSLAGAGMIITSGVNLVDLSVGVQVMNALLLPVMLAFLYLLARRLPQPFRLQGTYAALVGLIVLVTAGFAVYTALAGIIR